jgi:hypothetical protein
MIQISSRRVQSLITALVMASLLLIPAIARANGTPIRVRMAYQPPFSNAGPEDATGTIEIAFDDGEVHGDIEGLTQEAGTQYEVWLYNSKTEEILSLTTFQADPAGVTRFDALFEEPIPEDDWDLVVLTIEDDPDSSPEPDSRWSLVGTFADAEIVEETVPETLPETGNRAGPSEDAPLYAGLVLGGALAAGFAIALYAPLGRREDAA